MNKTLLMRTLIAAGALAAVGVAQAQYYQAPRVTTTTRTYVYTSPAYTYSYPAYVYSAPIVSTAPVITHYSYGVPITSYSYASPMGSAAATSNVPDRAGEASTMTGGAPNAVTNNNVVIGSAFVPYYDPYRGVYVY